MTTNESPHETPSLFDSRGVFCPLSSEQLHKCTASDQEAYQQVHRCYGEVAALERKLEVAGRNLHDKVALLRDASAAVSNMPKESHLDLCRQLAAQTGGRA